MWLNQFKKWCTNLIQQTSRGAAVRRWRICKQTDSISFILLRSYICPALRNYWHIQFWSLYYHYTLWNAQFFTSLLKLNWGIPWRSSGEDCTLSLPRAWAPPLVGELRHHKLQSRDQNNSENLTRVNWAKLNYHVTALNPLTWLH